MPVTTKDIARELNLSQSTVSRILNGEPGYRVAEATRQRVLEKAREMEYHPNAVARSLRSGRTHIIGLYTTHDYDVRNDFLGAVIGGLQRACGRRRLDLLLQGAFHGRSTDEIYSRVRSGLIDGLLLHAPSDDPLVERLSESSLPVVALADPMPGLPAVTCDDAHGMGQLVDYLWARGYRQFRWLAPTFTLASVERRSQAFMQELALRGVLEVDRQVIRVDFESAAPALPELTALGRSRPVAACCWNDRTAYTLLQTCLETGVRVPEQVAVTGFDGFRDMKLPARQLVTVECPWDRAAEVGLDLLSRLIEGRSVEPETMMPVKLLEGDTA